MFVKTKINKSGEWKANAMDRHIQQTNERLVCIKQALATTNGFQSAARELLEWCGDTRAFQKAFELNLIGCLTIRDTVHTKRGIKLPSTADRCRN
ncbi:Zinc finger MIZ domain-containing protein 1, variant 2 [Chamberlinius hualienensis]